MKILKIILYCNYFKCFPARFLSVIFWLSVYSLSGCTSAGEQYLTGEDDIAPILILAGSSDFGLYTGEILRAEGFNEYTIDSLTGSKINPSYLRLFDIIILGKTALTDDQLDLLKEYVSEGGILIAFRPDKKAASLFGLEVAEGSISEGYIAIETAGGSGKGLVSETLQFHGTADLYSVCGSEKIAMLYFDASESSDYPAVTMNRYKKGCAVAFTFNLPQSIVYTRQGNPEWAGMERDKVDGPTPSDLFYPMNDEKQWNDPGRIAIPQADEQMRLLSRIIEELSTTEKPLPRFWYFPDLYQGIFIFTIDGENNSAEEIDSEIRDIQEKGGNATLYEIGTYVPEETVRKWRQSGNEVAVHYDNTGDYSDPDFTSMNEVFDTMTANFSKAYGYSPKTVRNHWVVWCSTNEAGQKEFAQQALIEEKYGLGFDCNYYQFGGNKIYPNWMGDVGHSTGSGLPMKFSSSNGKIINVYQSNTQLPDETWLKENIRDKSITLIDRSIDLEYFAYLNANFHTWYWKDCRTPALQILDHCKKRGVPVWTAERVYDFLVMKDEAWFSKISWKDNRLSFRLKSAVKHSNGLTIMLPAIYNDSRIRHISLNGIDKEFPIRNIKGKPYAMLTVAPGATYEFIADYY